MLQGQNSQIKRASSKHEEFPTHQLENTQKIETGAMAVTR